MTKYYTFSDHKIKRILRKNGWIPVRQTGSHIIYINNNGNHITIRCNNANPIVFRRLIKENNLDVNL